MAQSELLLRILLTIVFGSILGLETETREIEKVGKAKANEEETRRLGGIRTYTIISLIGGVAGILFNESTYIITYMIFGSIILFLLAAYVLNVQQKKAFGLTTEVAVIITFIIGFLTTTEIIPIEAVLVIIVLLAFFLSEKRAIGELIHKIQHKEVIDVIKFGLVSIVILPLLPDKSYTILDFLKLLNIEDAVTLKDDILNFSLGNPFKIWFIVVFISGLNLVGYLASKIIGKKRGLIIASFFGGFVSSTSTLISLATKSEMSQNKKDVNTLAGSAIIANAVSFLPVSLLILITNNKLFSEVSLVLFLMFISGFILGIAFILQDEKNQKDHITLKYEPFSIIPAIKFVTLILVITILLQFINLTSLKDFAVFISAASGVIGVDAPVIALGNLAKTNSLTLETAALGILLTNAVNIFAKIAYSFTMGSPAFAKKVSIGLFLCLLVSLTYFVV